MASIKRLKKDVDYLTFAVVDDCLNCLAYGKGNEEVTDLIQNTINSRNELRLRINAGKGVAKNERKAYYKEVGKDLMATVDASFSKLSELVKKEA